MRQQKKAGTEENAYLTVYAALSLAVLLALFLAVMEGVRQSTIRLEAELITDIGLDSILAEYHRELFLQYGLLMIDTSYGQENPSSELTREHLSHYLSKNCDQEEVFLGDFIYRDFLALELQSVELTGMRLASDGNGSVFLQSGAEIMREETGLEYLKQLREWLLVVEEHDLNERDLEKEKQEADRQLAEHDGEEKQVGEEWITVEITNPTQALESKRQEGILKLVVGDVQALSRARVELEGLFSHRKEKLGINSGNLAAEETDFTDRLLFQEYLMRYMEHYGGEGKELLSYQIEYLIVGREEDLANLQGVVHRLSVIRGAANAMYLYGDREKCAMAEAAALAAATAMAVPEIASLLKNTILLGWAYAESLYDVKCLLAGERVPLLKTKESWHYSLEGALEGAIPEETEGEEGGLSYEDYLRILLSLTERETLTERAMDIVEMDIRATDGNGSFRIDGCVDMVEAQIEFSSKYGYEVTLCRQKQYQ